MTPSKLAGPGLGPRPFDPLGHMASSSSKAPSPPSSTHLPQAGALNFGEAYRVAGSFFRQVTKWVVGGASCFLVQQSFHLPSASGFERSQGLDGPQPRVPAREAAAHMPVKSFGQG